MNHVRESGQFPLAVVETSVNVHLVKENEENAYIKKILMQKKLLI